MQLKAYILVFDGLADWEPALALCEINKSKKFDIVSVGFSGNTVTTMGGYKISPDITLDAMKLENSGEPSFVIDATAMSSCTTTVYNHTIPPGGGPWFAGGLIFSQTAEFENRSPQKRKDKGAKSLLLVFKNLIAK